MPMRRLPLSTIATSWRHRKGRKMRHGLARGDEARTTKTAMQNAHPFPGGHLSHTGRYGNPTGQCDINLKCPFRSRGLLCRPFCCRSVLRRPFRSRRLLCPSLSFDAFTESRQIALDRLVSQCQIRVFTLLHIVENFAYDGAHVRHMVESAEYSRILAPSVIAEFGAL